MQEKVYRQFALINLKFQISNLKLAAENISRQLRAWADALQNSEIKGQRYLTEKTRRASKAKSEHEELMADLRRAQEENIRRQRKQSVNDE